MNAVVAACLVVACGAIGCSAPTDRAVASAEPAGSAAPSASASAASVVPVPPPVPPTLRAVPVHQTEKDLAGAALYTVPGAVLVGTPNRVGRLTEAGVEWKGSLDVDMPAFGKGVIRWVGGRWPDAIDVTYSIDNGRIPRPTYHPLTGEGRSAVFSEGGGMGWISGVARVGDSVLVSGYSLFEGQTTTTVRGPAIKRYPVAWPLRCKGEPKGTIGIADGTPPAIRPQAFGASRSGTLFSIGLLCDDEPAAEVWAKDSETPRIIELGSLVKTVSYAAEILQGPGDEVWVDVGEKEPIIVWRGDRFEALPLPPRPVRQAFVSTEGQLHLALEDAIVRLEGERWVEVARLVWPTDFQSLAVEDGVFWASTGSKLHRLEKGEPALAGEGCKTPFVHLYDVSDISEPKFTFPATRKALATFPQLQGVELVDFVAGRRRLGTVAPSWAVAEALAAHVRATMKDENPRVVCFEPKRPRKIPIVP